MLCIPISTMNTKLLYCVLFLSTCCSFFFTYLIVLAQSVSIRVPVSPSLFPSHLRYSLFSFSLLLLHLSPFLLFSLSISLFLFPSLFLYLSISLSLFTSSVLTTVIFISPFTFSPQRHDHFGGSPCSLCDDSFSCLIHISQAGNQH